MHDRAERRHTHWRVSRRAHLLAGLEESELGIAPGALDTDGQRLRRPRDHHPEIGPTPADWDDPEAED